MDITKRLIARSAQNISPDQIFFDEESFINRVILFNHYIIDSIAFLEIPYLIKLFTYNGFLDLLDSKVLSINMYPIVTGVTGQNYMANVDWPNSQRPLGTFLLTLFSPANFYEYVDPFLFNVINGLGLNGRKEVQLRRRIYSSLEIPVKEIDLSPTKATSQIIMAKPFLLSVYCAENIKRMYNKSIDPKSIILEPYAFDEFEVKIENNLSKDFSFSNLKVMRLFKMQFLTLASSQDRIQLMKTHSALTGITDVDLPLINENLNFLSDIINPQNIENNFKRVKGIRLGSYHQGAGSIVNVPKLLKIRESPECAMFRDWLTDIDKYSDEELNQMGISLTNRLSEITQSFSGKIIRFLITSLAGMIAPPGIYQLAPLGLSAIDSFLVDRIFQPTAQPLLFIDKLYPSIFKK